MVSMVAGANAALTAENPGLTSVLVGLGWETIPSRGPQAELVPMAIMVGHDEKAISNDHVVFFNQVASQDQSVTYASTDDKEEIDVDFSLVPPEVDKIAFIVYIDPDLRGPGDFSAVRSSYIRVASSDNRELVRFDIPLADNRLVHAMLFGELYRHRDDWKFRALGQGYANGLSGVAKDFNVEL